MRSRDRLRARASFGSRDIGSRKVIAIDGCGDTGSGLRMKARTGRIHTTTTIAKAGCSTRDIGTARTTTTTTGKIMTVDEGAGTTMMIAGTSITIRRKNTR